MTSTAALINLMSASAGLLKNSKKLVKIPLNNLIHTTEGICKYVYRQPQYFDVVQLTHLVFDKLDNTPLNFSLDIFIGGIVVTSISNEIIESEEVQTVSPDGFTNPKYRIKLPFDKIWMGNDIHHTHTDRYRPSIDVNYRIDGIQLISLKYSPLEYIFRTTNSLANVNLIQEENYLQTEWRDYLKQNVHTQTVIQMAYSYGMSNQNIELTHSGEVSGYYIHCRQPITTIKMVINGHERHNLDSDLIAIQCQRINAYTIYMPCSLDSKRFVLNNVSLLNHGRLDMVVMYIETQDRGSSHPVCIVSEIHRTFKYIGGMGSLTSGDNGTYTKNLTYTNTVAHNLNNNVPAIPRVIPEGEPNECVISRETIDPGMEYSRCTRCVAIYAFGNIQLWWLQNKSCPYCREQLPTIVKYVNWSPDDPNYVVPEPEPMPLQHWEIPGVAI